MKRSTLALVLWWLAFATPAIAQITIPYPNFVPGTVADPDQVDANNAALSSQALNRTGGTMSGTLTVLTIVPAVHDTYDLGTTGTRFQDLFLSGILNATGNATLGGTLTLTGAATLNSTLSVASTSTFTQLATFSAGFTASSIGSITANDPIFEVVDADGAADAKRWRLQGGTNVLGVFTANDANSVTSPGLQLTRSGNSVSRVAFYTSDVERMRLAGAGALLIGDTSNLEQDVGLTIRQDPATANEAISLKGTAVAHGLAATETDTYAAVSARDNVLGGLSIEAFSEATSASVFQMDAQAASGSGDTSKGTGSTGFIQLRAFENAGSVGANENLLVIGNATSTKFIFDAEGDAHNDGTTWTAYDSFDDLALIDTIDHVLDPTLRALGRLDLAASRAWLTEAKLVSFDATGHPFVNTSRLQMLHNGALRQMAEQVRDLDAQIAQLRAELAALKTKQP